MKPPECRNCGRPVTTQRAPSDPEPYFVHLNYDDPTEPPLRHIYCDYGREGVELSPERTADPELAQVVLL